MWTCPVCGRQQEQTVCTQCGFDESCNYERYPTLTPVGRAEPISVKRARWARETAELMRCPSCGGMNFSYQPASNSFRCSDCGRRCTPERTPKAPEPGERWRWVPVTVLCALLLCLAVGLCAVLSRANRGSDADATVQADFSAEDTAEAEDVAEDEVEAEETAEAEGSWTSLDFSSGMGISATDQGVTVTLDSLYDMEDYDSDGELQGVATMVTADGTLTADAYVYFYDYYDDDTYTAYFEDDWTFYAEDSWDKVTPANGDYTLLLNFDQVEAAEYTYEDEDGYTSWDYALTLDGAWDFAVDLTWSTLDETALRTYDWSESCTSQGLTITMERAYCETDDYYAELLLVGATDYNWTTESYLEGYGVGQICLEHPDYGILTPNWPTIYLEMWYSEGTTYLFIDKSLSNLPEGISLEGCSVYVDLEQIIFEDWETGERRILEGHWRLTIPATERKTELMEMCRLWGSLYSLGDAGWWFSLEEVDCHSSGDGYWIDVVYQVDVDTLTELWEIDTITDVTANGFMLLVADGLVLLDTEDDAAACEWTYNSDGTLEGALYLDALPSGVSIDDVCLYVRCNPEVSYLSDDGSESTIYTGGGYYEVPLTEGVQTAE